MRVAVAQFTASRDKAANRDRLGAFVTAAAGAGADLVVAPEAAMHPFGRPEESLTAAAEPLDGAFVAALTAAVRGTGSTVVAGMFEAITDDDHAFNTVVVVDGTGLRGAYRKVHLFDAFGWRESDRLRAGAPAHLLVIPIADLSVGVLTCYDLRFPEICRALVDRGATLLAVPAAWVAGPLKEDHWLTLCRARAIENTCYLAGAGQGPPDYAGRSLVVDPMGVILAQRGEIDGVAVADVDAARVGQVRGTLPSLQHRRYDVVARAVPPGH
ncbi:MAG: carbon-nitrogen hydrolase family protein [Actinomycetota bacterium]|nr:carbon-nitrogen hydrolase family protein [Actinomycetota bacterium]